MKTLICFYWVTLAFQAVSAAPDYSIMPGADLLFRVDLEAIRSTPFYKTLQDDHGEGAEDPALLLKNEMLSLTMAADLDSLNTPVYWHLLALWRAGPSVSQVRFASAASVEAISAGFPGAAEAVGFAGLLRGSANGGTACFPSAFAESAGVCGVLSEDKRSWFFATLEADARAAAERCNAGKEERPSDKLAALVDPNAQVNLVLLTSEAMKQVVAGRLSPEHNPSIARDRYAVDSITPFVKLQSFSFSLRLEGTEAMIAMAADFGDDENAILGAASMQRIISQYLNLYDNELRGKRGAGNIFRFKQDGRMVRMNVTLNGTELLAIRNTILPRMKGPRADRDRDTCKLYLRQINANTRQFMLEGRTDVPPTTEQLSNMFRGSKVPTCPAGGTYTMPTTKDGLPTCSMGKDKGHSLEGK